MATLLFAQFQLNRSPVSRAAPTEANAAADQPAPASTSSPTNQPVTIHVTSDKAWIDTGIDFKAGDTVRITAQGEMGYVMPPSARGGAAGKSLVTPKGVARGFRDLMRTYPVNDGPRGALIGRFGNSPAARAFLVGAEWQGRAPMAGDLFLGLNQTVPSASEGAFEVQIIRVNAPAMTEVYDLPEFPQELVDQIPRRVQDAAGTEGDRTNFVIVATRERVREALAAAGWSIVDKDKGSAVVSGILATLSRRSYVTLPMSELILFGRTQDFGYAQGDPVRVVAERHHFRLWQAPFDLQGLTVWAGAGTHDIGFDKDQRTGGLTHKIDSEVDREREYILESLSHTGLVVKSAYLTPGDPIRQAKTAHGQEFFSDGRTLIIYLKPGSPEAASPKQ